MKLRGKTFFMALLAALSGSGALPGRACKPYPEVSTDGHRILIEGNPTFLKGVAYSPFIAGDAPWTGARKVNFLRDLREIKRTLHANALRIYDPLPRAFYDAARQEELWVIQGIFLPDSPESYRRDLGRYLLNPDWVSDQKDKIRAAIDDIHDFGAEDVILAYAIGNSLSTEVVANTIFSNQSHPRFQGTFFKVPGSSSLPEVDIYGGFRSDCAKPLLEQFPDPHPYQSLLAELAETAASHEMARCNMRHLIGHAITPMNNSFLGARDRQVPTFHLPIDLGFLDIIFENIHTYNVPYITYHGFSAYIERLKAAYPSTPVVVLESGYSTSPTAWPVPEPLCGFPYSTPAYLSLSFGGVSEAEQALAIEARFVDVACSREPLAGFFAYSFYDEWWLGGDTTEFKVDRRDDHPLEHFGLKRVSGRSTDFTVSDKPAFHKLADLYGCEEPDADPDACGLVIRTPRLLEGTYGIPFENDFDGFQVAGGKAPYHWSIEDSAALPPGLAFEGPAGRITGAPERMGTFRFRLRVQDSSSPPRLRDRLECLRILPPEFTTRGREILLNDRPFFLKGMDYSPLIAGDAPWSRMVRADPFKDLKEIKEVLHANAIRIYTPLPKSVYDAARENGLFVIQGIHLQVDGPHPDPQGIECEITDIDLMEPEFFRSMKEEVLGAVDEIHNQLASDVILSIVVGNEINFCVQRSTILKNQWRPRYQGTFYSVPDNTELPRLDRYDGCPLSINEFEDPHPFQSFITELVDLAAVREAEKYGVRHLMAHATDPNMSIAPNARDRYLPGEHFPVDLGFLDIVFQNVYSYFPPFLRFIGFKDYLEEAKNAYPNTPFVILECGYSTSPESDFGDCATPSVICGQPREPRPFSYCFGLNKEEEQAQGLAVQYEAASTAGLTAGFFVFEYFDEWWKGGNRSEFVHDEDRAEEWFGIKRVRGIPQNYTVSNKPAFETVGRMFDTSWCPEGGALRCTVLDEGVEIEISLGAAGPYDAIALKRDGVLLVELGPGETTYLDPGPPERVRVYSVAVEAAHVQCPEFELECVEIGPSSKDFRRGDSDHDSMIDVSDAIATLTVLFLGFPLPACPDAVDSNDDGLLDVSDAVFTLHRLFLGGRQFPPPGSEICGPDPTPDAFSECAYLRSLCGGG